MLIWMKTTMNLPDALFAVVKQRAVAEGRTVTSFMEQALRAYLERDDGAAVPAVTLPSWGGGSAGGYLVDIADRDALWAALDDAS